MNSERSKFSKICDWIIFNTIVFTIFLLLYKQVIKIKFTYYSLSVISTLVIFLLLYKIVLKINYKLKLKHQEQLKLEKIKMTMRTKSKQEISMYFKQIFTKQGYKTISKNYHIVLNHTNIVCINFYENILTETSLIKLFSNTNFNNFTKITIFCINFDKSCDNFANLFNTPKITLYNFLEIYEYLKSINQLPKTNNDFEKPKTNRYKHIKKIINNLNAKQFFFASISIYFLGIFSKQFIYYSIAASVCLIISLIILLKRIFTKHPKIQKITL